MLFTTALLKIESNVHSVPDSNEFIQDYVKMYEFYFSENLQLRM